MEIINGNVGIPGSCGFGNVPAVATFSTDLTCNVGLANGSYQTPVANIVPQLNIPVPRVTIPSSATQQNLLIGNFSDACITAIEEETGLVDLVNLCDAGFASNRSFDVLCCVIDSMTVTGTVLFKTADDVSGLNGVSIIFNICNPCFTSDVEFTCVQGCTNTFALANAFMGRNTGLIISVPAGVSGTLEFCSCSQEAAGLSGCAVGAPVIAPIPTFCPPCPPAPLANQVGVGQPLNGGAVLTGQRRF